MVHHQGYISLGQIIKAFSLRQDTADQFMIDFAGTFLIRTTRITIKEVCTAHRYCIPVLNLLWIGKLTSVIRKYNRKQMVEILCPKNTVKRLKDVVQQTERTGFVPKRAPAAWVRQRR